MKDMKTVPHQKIVVNNYNPKKDFVKTDKNAFVVFNEASKDATSINKISAEAFILWQELRLLYYSNEEMALSPANIAAELYNNTEDATIRNIRKHLAKLEEAGWLTKIKGNLYEFTVPGNRNCEFLPEEQPELVVPTNRNCEFLPIGTDSSVNRNCGFLENRLDIVDIIDSENETSTASSYSDAASEDAEASSGYNYIEKWNAEEKKYRDLLRPIQESGVLKKFIKGTITPWHYDKNKSQDEQEYYDKLTALSLWNRVTYNSNFIMANDCNSKHPCFSLKEAYRLWNQAEIFTPKDKD